MKKSALFIACLLVSNFVLLFAKSNDMEMKFYELLGSDDITRADSVLTVWRVAEPETAGVLMAEGKLLAIKSKKRTVKYVNEMSARDSAMVNSINEDGGELLEFVKSVPVTEYDDSLISEANDRYIRAIKISPERLTYRFAQISDMTRDGKKDLIDNCVSEFGGRYRADDPWIDDYGNVITPDSVPFYVAQCFYEVFMQEDGHKIDVENLRHLTKAVEKELTGVPLTTTLSLMAYVLFEKGDSEGAIEYWLKMLPLVEEPELSRLNTSLAIGYRAIGDVETAKEYASKAAQSPLADPDVAEYAAQILLLADDNEQVITYRNFQFQVLPSMLINEIPEDALFSTLLNPDLVIEQLKSISNVRIDRDVEVVSAVLCNRDSVNMVVWEMPKPEEKLDCKYIAFVSVDGHYRYFTLEKTIPIGDYAEVFIVCEIDVTGEYNYKHFNYGIVVDDTCTLDDFAKMVLDIVKDRNISPAASFVRSSVKKEE